MGSKLYLKLRAEAADHLGIGRGRLSCVTSGRMMGYSTYRVLVEGPLDDENEAVRWLSEFFNERTAAHIIVSVTVE